MKGVEMGERERGKGGRSRFWHTYSCFDGCVRACVHTCMDGWLGGKLHVLHSIA